MDYSNFSWINESTVTTTGEGLVMEAQGNCDLFCAPDGRPPVHSANIYSTEISGDFVFSAKVALDVQGDFDASGLVLYAGPDLWMKACLEQMEPGRVCAVSVVTNGLSDDSVGSVIPEPYLWLYLVRKGNTFAIHYSEDGKQYFKLRVCHLPMPEKIRTGFLAQAPRSSGGPRAFSDIRLEQRTVENVRNVE